MLTVANQAINLSSHPSAVSRQQLSAVSCQPSAIQKPWPKGHATRTTNQPTLR
ncbi:hypothetical protein [Moorena bouillonii]|uniref:hypothetical protein n=1 Tax=Moorena bouillonii TaxID=207920 RepID=UPI001300E6DB|nr:hypothetical protein [Moorena bouillonii]